MRTVLFGILLLLFLIDSNAASYQPRVSHKNVSQFLSSRPQSAPASFDCAMRNLAWDYAQLLQPWRTNLAEVHSALELGSLCSVKYDNTLQKETLKKLKELPGEKRIFPTAINYYVDPVVGSDLNPGTLAKPFLTLEYAIAIARTVSGPKTIFLRAGVYYISKTIELGPVDNNLSISSYNNEDVEISGAKPIKTSWQPYKVNPQPVLEEYTGANNVYSRIDYPGQNSTTLRCLGKFQTVQLCRTACQNFNEDKLVCYAYTFHTPALSNSFAGYCYADITQLWGPNPQQNVISGRFVRYNIYVADLATQSEVGPITGLQLQKGSGRITRARYPSADIETSFYPDGWIYETQAWAPPKSYPKAVTVETDQPIRTDNAFFFKYSMGVGGPCSIFDPPESYWCSQYNAGGDPGLFETPQGLTFLNGTFLNVKFPTGPSTAVAHVWHSYHWSMWMYQVDSISSATNQINWSYGGFQGARGSILTHGGSEWFLENTLELLDTPNEYFYDTQNSLLYLFYNGTTPPPDNLQFVATNLKVLFNVVGTQSDPVKNINFNGIRFTGGAYTYLDPHGVPSGGDWALQRTAFLFFEGTENVTIQECSFIRLDGISLMFSGFNRGSVVQRSEFAWTGESAVAAWGYTQGIDGTDGNQPIGVQFLYNFVREIGHFEKQSSAWFQAKSAKNILVGNIIFNGPRALININDGFGGGTKISQNLLFNANRETSDQGPFNSWDRLPYITTIFDGTPSLTPAYNEIDHNFFVCNYGSNMCIDNDDGSSYYLLHDNFEVYGGHKSDFGGHNKYTYNSINAYSKVYSDGVCCDIETQPPNFVPNYVDAYYNNTCIQSPIVPYISHSGCDPNKPNPQTLSFTHNNRVYNANQNATIACAKKIFTEAEWQALGFDLGSTAYPLPADSEIIAWAKALLNIR